jgi:hypothetical protein
MIYKGLQQEPYQTHLHTMFKVFTYAFLFGALLLMPLAFLHAQVTLEIPDYILEPGDEINVPVKVEGFNDIVGAQFQVEWDPAVLEYQGTGDYNLPGLGISNFGPAAPYDSLKVAWFTLAAAVSLPDGSALFTIGFKAIGQHQDTTSLKFSTSFPIEIIDTAPLDVTIIPGFISIDDPNDLQEVFVFPQKIRLEQNQPNPFFVNTQIPFELKETSKLCLRIFDLNGRQVWMHQADYPAGKHYLTISNHDLPAPGTYHYTLTTYDVLLTKELIFIQ